MGASARLRVYTALGAPISIYQPREESGFISTWNAVGIFPVSFVPYSADPSLPDPKIGGPRPTESCVAWVIERESI